MSNELSFNAKIDLWVLVLLLAAVSVCVWALAESWSVLVSLGPLWYLPISALLAIGILLPLWILISLRYFLSEDSLRVRCGPFHWHVSIRDIRDVSETQNLKSSPSMSLDRLRIDYGDGRSVMISPEPRQEFLRQLEHRRRLAAA